MLNYEPIIKEKKHNTRMFNNRCLIINSRYNNLVE